MQEAGRPSRPHDPLSAAKRARRIPKQRPTASDVRCDNGVERVHRHGATARLDANGRLALRRPQKVELARLYFAAAAAHARAPKLPRRRHRRT
eukprot:3965916-Prymnesium_polylepis.1